MVVRATVDIMRQLLPARGIEPFRLTSASGSTKAGVIRRVRVVPVSGISTCWYPASRVSGPGWRCNSLSRAALHRAVLLPLHLTNSLIIFADAADTLREKNVLWPTVNSHRPDIYGHLASIGSHVAIPIAFSKCTALLHIYISRIILCKVEFKKD